MREKIISLGLIIVMCCMLFLPCIQVDAAQDGTVALTGLEQDDIVEIYRVANYNENANSYSWTSAVAEWMAQPENAEVYQGLTPSALSAMQSAASKEFFEKVLVGLRKESDGIANLPGYSFPVEDATQATNVSVTPGYYTILPKGTHRIYELKWFQILPGQALSMDYTDRDYQLPTITTTAVNVTGDRGGLVKKEATSQETTEEVESTKEAETPEGETGETTKTAPGGVVGENYDYPLVMAEDSVRITSDMTVPEYSGMYATGKRIYNISLVMPKQFAYEKDSLVVKASTAGSELQDVNVGDYSLQSFQTVTIYRNVYGEMIFFGTEDGYYYEMDGTLLKTGTAQEALLVYNENHKTSYSLEQKEEVTQESETVKTESLGEEGETTDPLILTGVTEYGLLIISMDTAKDYGAVHTEYQVTKNQQASDTGIYDHMTLLSYSVSPLDGNCKGKTVQVAQTAGFGIRITACEGKYESYQMDASEILSTAQRMTEDEFNVYKQSDQYEGESKEDVQLEQVQDEKVIPIYDRETNTTTEYTLLTTLTVDSGGEATLGGIEPGGYLIVQSKHPAGYTMSQTSLVIGEGDWIDETVMEGNYLLDVVWLDYETVYLPATGVEQGDSSKTAGIMLIMTGCLLLARLVRKRYHG